MSKNFFNIHTSMQRAFAVFAIAALLSSAIPAQIVFAAATSTDEGTGETTIVSGCTDPTALNYDSTATEDDGSCEYEEATASSTEGTNTGEGDTGTSTATSLSDGTSGATGTTTSDTTGTSTPTSTPDGTTGTSTGDGTGGGDGNTQGDNGGSGTTTTATSTDSGTTTNDGTDGTEGGGGGDGADNATSTEASPEDQGDPVPVFAENEIGEDGTEEDEEEVTGTEVVDEEGGAVIETGPANAQGQVMTDANSSDVKSVIETFPGDLDTYTFNATGTNEAVVDTEGLILALTGENEAYSQNGVADITTGDAVSAFNIANVINSNVVNSDGYLYLKNDVLEPKQSLDLRSFFFPDEEGTLAGADDCDLLSCYSEDVVYNFSQTNHATVTNNGTIEAVTGKNVAEGQIARIKTGDARGGANVINVVNSNIIDSNYRLLTYNALGDLDGDLMLPTEELFKAFFGKPNGLSQTEGTEGPESSTINVDNDNLADVENNVDAKAESGDNLDTTAFDSDIKTGQAESESNILNEVNENVFGGDSMYLLIRVHGFWSGDVHGLPEGLTWQWTPDGILIYNEGAEIEPSELLPYDADTYTANFTNQNRLHLENNIDIDAITGENKIDGLAGSIKTGNAYASANVMNIANTNIIGSNWTMAVVNIFGDFNGDVTFTETDLSLTGEVSPENPYSPGEQVNYAYTVTNNGENPATNVVLEQTLENAFASGTNNTQTANLGTIAAGASKQVTLSATVDPNLSVGTHTVTAVAHVGSDEADGNEGDNSVLIESTAVHEAEDTSSDDDTGTTTDDGSVDDSSTSTDNGNGTSIDDGSGSEDGDDNNNNNSNNDTNGNNNYSGGGSSNDDEDEEDETETETLAVERTQIEVDPTDPPHLTVLKEADVTKGEPVTAGKDVNYTITVMNQGGGAYDATVYDTLKNPVDSVISEQSWELGTILPGEQIELNYTTAYSKKTPSGTYTNTAHLEAYRLPGDKEAGKDPLRLDDAVYTIDIDGVDLAVGNVDVIAYFPQSDGGVGALLSWETSKPAVSRVYYSPQGLFSPFNQNAHNYGYLYSSAQFPEKKTKHFMILMGLNRGITYTYRIHAESDAFSAFGGDYTFTVPGLVNTLTLAFPVGGQTSPTSRVAGASTGAPRTPTAPAPAPAVAPPQNPTPKTEPEPEPEPEPEQQEGGGGVGGFVKKAADTVFGFFR